MTRERICTTQCKQLLSWGLTADSTTFLSRGILGGWLFFTLTESLHPITVLSQRWDKKCTETFILTDDLWSVYTQFVLQPLTVCVFVDNSSESVDRLLLERFRKLSRFPEAFSSVHYVGTQTLNPPTDFRGLQNKLEQLLNNNSTRSPRSPVVIFKAMEVWTQSFYIYL